jgi:hypothetical protein
MKMDHERCSELLSAFARGEVGDAEKAAIEDHLRTCADCRGELAAVEALTAETHPRLSELERARLRRVVLEEAVPLPDEPRAYPTPRRARTFQLLGTAALLVVVGGFAYLGLSAGGTDRFSGADSGGDATGVVEERGAARGKGFGDAAGGAGEASDAAAGMESENLTLDAEAVPAPLFDAEAGVLSTKRLDRLGRNGLPLVSFSRSFTVADVPAYQQRYVEELAAAAPAARGRDIVECAAPVFEEFPNSLLAYAGLGDYEDRGNVLVLAFAWTDSDGGPLDRSMVWAWSISDCGGVPVHYSTSRIRPRR